MIAVLIILLILIGGTGWYLAIRSMRVMLNQDQNWSDVVELLWEYATELEKLTSGDILTDHPEVLKFHRLNLVVLGKIKEVVESNRRRVEEPKQQLPRPDVE